MESSTNLVFLRQHFLYRVASDNFPSLFQRQKHGNKKFFLSTCLDCNYCVLKMNSVKGWRNQPGHAVKVNTTFKTLFPRC